jgi:hypothetical protein
MSYAGYSAASRHYAPTVARVHLYGGVLNPAGSGPPAGPPSTRQCSSDTPRITATPRIRTSIPPTKTTPTGSMIPATVSTAPAIRSRAPRRVRTARTRPIAPMAANSTPVRIHLRIRPERTCRVNIGAPYLPARPADELHTTRLCRCDRSLIVLAAALCSLNGTPSRSSRPLVSSHRPPARLP